MGEPPQQVKEKIDKVREEAAKHGREVEFGLRVHVIVRETNEEAWKAANDLIKYVDEDAIQKAQQVFSRYDSIGQKKMTELNKGNRSNLEIYPNLWAGVGLVRGGCGTAIVGDPETVAERIREYQSIGIDKFVLSGYPHLEEAYQFAELVFPLLGYKQDKQSTGAPKGEVVGYDYTAEKLARV